MEFKARKQPQVNLPGGLARNNLRTQIFYKPSTIPDAQHTTSCSPSPPSYQMSQSMYAGVFAIDVLQRLNIFLSISQLMARAAVSFLHRSSGLVAEACLHTTIIITERELPFKKAKKKKLKGIKDKNDSGIYLRTVTIMQVF